MNYNDGPTAAALIDIKRERLRQLEKWGKQSRTFADFHTQGPAEMQNLNMMRTLYDIETTSADGPRWDTILGEELLEARTAGTIEELRTELVQSAAVIVAMIEQIDRQEYINPDFVDYK